MPRVSSENNDTQKRAPRRRVAKPKTASAGTLPNVSASRRKSPTALPTTSYSSDSRRKFSPKKYIAVGLMISGLAVAGFIGYSDKGQIDIAAVITERNAKLTAGVADSDGTSNVIVPVQNTSDLPNGGLIPSTEPAPQRPAPIETATTSTSTATTTEEVSSSEESGEPTSSEEEVAEPTTETIEIESTSL